MKDATGNLPQTLETLEACQGDIDIYSGEDALITPMMSIGGKGVISVLSNVAPRDTHDICAKYLAGDVKGSLELQMKYLPLIRALFCEVNPIPVKKALNLMGMEVGPMRMPLTEMEEANAKVLLAELKKVGIVK